MASRARPLWRCPQCGHRFVTKNLSHSCGRYRLASHFRGRSKAVRAAFDAALWLRRRIDHPRLIRIESYGRLGYGIHFRLTKPEDVDRRLEALMREAYALQAGQE